MDNLIGRLQGEWVKAVKEHQKLDDYDPNRDIMYQVVKDLHRYIADMEHTLSLIEDGTI